MGAWTLEDIPWDRFDRSKVAPDILSIVKAAGLVEHNGADYAQYLCRVFHDDPAFQARMKELYQPLRLLPPDQYAAELTRSTKDLRDLWATAPFAVPAGLVSSMMRRDVPQSLKALRRECERG